MSYTDPMQLHQARNQIIRRDRLLEKIPISKSKLYALLDEDGPYYLPSFPRPFYLPGGRTPFWREDAVDDFIWASEFGSLPRPTTGLI